MITTLMTGDQDTNDTAAQQTATSSSRELQATDCVQVVDARQVSQPEATEYPDHSRTGQPNPALLTQQEDDKGQQSEGAPEKYEFKAPEGTQFDSAILGAYSEVTRELNLSQDAAQKMLDKVAPVIQARQVEQIAAVQSAWEQEARSDKEFGGDTLDENLGVAKQALEVFGSPGLKELLRTSGLGNHPEIIRVLYRVGKATGGDRVVSGQGSVAVRHDARRLYAASNMNP